MGKHLKPPTPAKPDRWLFLAGHLFASVVLDTAGLCGARAGRKEKQKTQ
jgi:hypothetical protein